MTQKPLEEIYTCGVLTLSDKGSQGERQDTSGLALGKLLEEEGYQILAYEIIPDKFELIAKTLASWVDERGIDLIVTTGGTGVSPGDVTPEATATILEREIPGTVAMAWAIPIRSASRKGIFFLPGFTSWVEISKSAVNSRAPPTSRRFPENNDFTSSRKRRPNPAT